MKRRYKIPGEYRVVLFILAAFFLIVASSRIQKWVLEQQIQRRFEQSFAAFDCENMEFTIFYGPACAGEDYEISSSQATPELRQAAQDFVRNLKLDDSNGLSPYENGRKVQYQIYMGGDFLSVQYCLPSGDAVHAGVITEIKAADGQRFCRNFLSDGYAPLKEAIVEFLGIEPPWEVRTE